MSQFFLTLYQVIGWSLIRMYKLVKRSYLQLLSFYICAGIILVEVLTRYFLSCKQLDFTDIHLVQKKCAN